MISGVRSSSLVCLALLGLSAGAVSIPAATGARPAAKAELPDDLELVIAAAPPLVRYPMMGCFDDRGRLYIGDSAGMNLRPKDLEVQLPSRVLMLEDTDHDGVFDKSTVYADKMTFPQGACWLNGSLYVASPPGIWKFTDTDGDGVADRREMIVGGFEYDGNAADVHGPFLHPTNGRIYWCHGRKGHKVVQKDGTLVHEGKASGIWSCRPDGSDVQWHSLGCMDNPVEIDFTPEGQIVGVVNLYYNQPRGDTLVHWLYGGVYERPDLLNVIADLPRTRESMPVVHNFGHVAVSGFTRYRSGGLNPAWKDNLFVTFFNTQKLVRVTMTGVGATYRATEHEFLKLHDPDAHFTDVIEDPADGSLLVLNTGGWFRIGCPSSIAEKPDFRGAIYRVRPKTKPDVVRPVPPESALPEGDTPFARLRALEAMAVARTIDGPRREALRQILSGPLEPTLEHAAMFAAMATRAFDLAALRQATATNLVRRLLVILERTMNDASVQDEILSIARKHVDSLDPDLARTAVIVASRHPRAVELCNENLRLRLAETVVSPGTLNLINAVVGSDLAKPAAQSVVTALLGHPSLVLRRAAWKLLAEQSGNVVQADWIPPLERSLAAAAEGGGDLPLVIDAVAKLQSKRFDPALQSLVNDGARPSPIRMRALAALSRSAGPLSAESFALLLDVSKNGTSTAARLDAARFLTRSRLSKEQFAAMAPLLATAGPMEIAEFLKSGRRLEAPMAQLWAENFVRSPVLSSVAESAIRGAFSNLSPETYERILGPAARAASAIKDGKKRKLEMLAAAAEKGRAAEGKGVFAASSCVACHKAGDLGRPVGPDLSRIGQIRKSRDVLESILFPSATIARDFETHVVETGEGETYSGAVRRDSTDGLVLVDLTGEEKKIPHSRIVGHTTLATSLMPEGLEQAFSDQQLLDLTAWLVSLR